MDLAVKLFVAAAVVYLLRNILSVVNFDAIADEAVARNGLPVLRWVIFPLLVTVFWVLSAWQVRAGRYWAPSVLGGVSLLPLLSAVYDLFDLGVYSTVGRYFDIGVLGVLEVSLRFVTVVLATGTCACVFKGLLSALRTRRKTVTRG